VRCGIWHWSSAGSPGVSVAARSGRPSSAATSPTPARSCRGWPICPPRARSRSSASSTAPTTTGGALSIPPRRPPSAGVLAASRYRFLARPSRSASALAGGLRYDYRRLVGCGSGCPARLAAWFATPRSPGMPSAGMSRSAWRPPANPLRRLERRKARQVTWATKHNGGRYSNRLGRTISQIAKLRARQTRRRQERQGQGRAEPGRA